MLPITTRCNYVLDGNRGPLWWVTLGRICEQTSILHFFQRVTAYATRHPFEIGIGKIKIGHRDFKYQGAVSLKNVVFRAVTAYH